VPPFYVYRFYVNRVPEKVAASAYTIGLILSAVASVIFVLN